jgi:hypothetical protein
MIDFETSAPAIPFFKGMHAYETIAFQFSHHIMERSVDGKVQIRHANQWISTQAETFPSVDFVRALKKALMPSGELKGTVFRYHNHENTVLRKLRALIVRTKAEIQDFQELIDFIDLITKSSDGESIAHEGSKKMVDLHRLIQEGFYSGKAGGSISLKFTLPAMLDNFGNSVQTVLAVESSVSGEAKGGGRRTGSADVAFRALKALLEDDDSVFCEAPAWARDAAKELGCAAPKRAETVRNWRAKVDASRGTRISPEAARKYFQRAMKPLVNTGQVLVWSDMCWLA